MSVCRRLCALVLAGALACVPTAAYSVSKGAMKVAPATAYSDINTASAVFSTTPDADDTSITASSGKVSLSISGTASTTAVIAVTLTRKSATTAQASAFGKVCGSILKACAPSASLTTANTALKLEDIQTTGVRTYSVSDILFSYAVSTSTLRFSAIALPSVDDGIKIALNDSFLTLDVMPQIVSSRTMVPMRGIFEKLDASVAWDSDSRTVTVTSSGGTKICVTIDSTTATVGGKSVTLDAAPMIVNGRTLVPIRFLAESLGAQVGWNSATQTVVISAR